jgi:hypothetical protein
VVTKSSEQRAVQEERTESRWPPALAVLAALLLYITLPPHLTLGPAWLMPALVVVLLLPLVLMGPVRPAEAPVRRKLGILLIAIVNAANIASLVLLVHTLLTPGNKENGWALLVSATAIWLTNILVFGLWYWELDRGGPQARLRASRRDADFMFSQMIAPSCAPMGWLPSFADYLYVAFTNATAFSPTDTMPLSTIAKALMTVEALISLLTVLLVAARAVNILA